MLGDREQITTIQEFVDLINNVKNDEGLLFRGQQGDWCLLPKLARLVKNKVDDFEKRMIDDFKRSSLPLLEFKPENDWDWLAIAQHHGLPTRLLDWTHNALMAMWFAVANDKNKNNNSVIWVLAPDKKDFKADEEKFCPSSCRITKIFLPKVISRRISAQWGAFTVHYVDDSGKVIAFQKDSNFSNKLLKIKIPAKKQSDIRKSLDMLGVNGASVFPDIDGLCGHLEWKYLTLKR